MWLDREDQWVALVGHLRAAGEFGLDTETYGQPDKTSPQHRARVHCWSVGVLRGPVGPRGYRRAVGRVLPSVALDHPVVRGLLSDTTVAKWAHNAPHDRHALENEGLEVRGLQDSLQWLRVAVPGRRDYGLKDAEQWALGHPPRPSFRDLVSYQAKVVRARRHRERGCVCGARPCRAKSTSEWHDPATGVWRPHTRVEWTRFTAEHGTRPWAYEVTEFTPGADLEPLVWNGATIPRWDAWVAYSLADAVRGIELVDWIRNRKPTEVRYPWGATP